MVVTQLQNRRIYRDEVRLSDNFDTGNKRLAQSVFLKQDDNNQLKSISRHLICQV